MKKTKIWFNRWFSVAYHYMNWIRDNNEGVEFKFYATHPDIAHMSLQAADHAEVEPVLEPEAYVEFCLEFCERHQIDVFIPRLKMLAIAKQVHRFEQIGTKVMVCSDIPLLESLMEKQKFYESVALTGIMQIPDYHVVQTADQFMIAYQTLTAQGHRVCIKPTNSEGGMGFRVIDPELDELTELFGPINRNITPEHAYRILSSVDHFDDLMVMELLSGFEYSIDCLASASGELLAAVPRRKAGGRLRLMEEVPELIEIAERVAATYKIPFNYNIQMKYNNGIPKLLEINPRMSGGLHVTCLAGVNFPYLAVKLLLGEQVDVQHPNYGILASHIEKSVIMSGVAQKE
ncbi:ATP-grasp domain-containing protein [Paenibacillus eucommiae]|uniref:Biotin carboxylase n=1 Tax=Paenibacillus eucommiae TaxID=1355755 RepID=A0ABS4J0Z6_9BACL|nr:ATP-grasp domain-containing protein [Paenibacillus eucommiae]MBP1993486.1 biotin carboxylase [Paenibacillus eucommiae]